MSINVTTYGAVGNGTTDDTVAIQAALNAAASSASESVVYMPEGVYLIASGSLSIPKGVSLEGPAKGVQPKWNAATGAWVMGSGATLAIMYNPADKSEASAAIRMTSGSRLAKCNIWYPNQPVSGGGAIVAYPPSVGLVADPLGANGGNVSRPIIEEVCVSNAYKFVSWTLRHDLGTIRDIYGTAIHTFITLDKAYDVDRLFDVHCNPNAAYVGDWASNGIIDRQYTIGDGAMINMARADQAYILRCFGFGFRKGLYLTDFGSGGANGLQVMQSGWEGCANPIDIVASTEALMFSQIVLGDASIIGAGFPGGSAVRCNPPANTFCNNMSFEQVKVFSAAGPAFEMNYVNGLTILDSYLEQIKSAGGFLRGAVEVKNAARFAMSNCNIKVQGSQIIGLIAGNLRGFNIRDNWYDGQAAGGTSPMAVTNSQAGRITGNLEGSTSGSSRNAYLAGNTDVTAETFRNFVN